MTTHQYHKVLPTSNNSNGFTSHDSIDFLINASPDRALVPNSIEYKRTCPTDSAPIKRYSEPLVLNVFGEVTKQMVFGKNGQFIHLLTLKVL